MNEMADPLKPNYLNSLSPEQLINYAAEKLLIEIGELQAEIKQLKTPTESGHCAVCGTAIGTENEWGEFTEERTGQ